MREFRTKRWLETRACERRKGIPSLGLLLPSEDWRTASKKQEALAVEGVQLSRPVQNRSGSCGAVGAGPGQPLSLNGEEYEGRGKWIGREGSSRTRKERVWSVGGSDELAAQELGTDNERERSWFFQGEAEEELGPFQGGGTIAPHFIYAPGSTASGYLWSPPNGERPGCGSTSQHPHLGRSRGGGGWEWPGLSASNLIVLENGGEVSILGRLR